MLPFRPLMRTMMSVGKALAGCHSRSSTHWGSSALQPHRASLPSLTHTSPHGVASWRTNRQLHHGPVAASAAAVGAGDSTPHTFLFTSESVTEVYPVSTVHYVAGGAPGVEHVIMFAQSQYVAWNSSVILSASWAFWCSVALHARGKRDRRCQEPLVHVTELCVDK